MRDDNPLPAYIRQQESLRAVIEAISSELELRPLLTRIIRYACELIGADRGTVGLVDWERGLIRTEAIYEMPLDELGAEMFVGVGLAGRVLLTQSPVILNRYGELDRPTQSEMLEDAVIGMPIFWRGQLTGFLGIGANPPRQFNQQDAETLGLYARHAAIAIENARLFAEMQRALIETQLLYATARRISFATNIDEVVEAYLEQVAARADYACTIVLYQFNPEGQRTGRVVRGWWSPDGGLNIVYEHSAYSRDALDEVLDRGQTVKISDVNHDARVPADLRQLQAESNRPAVAMIPLMVHSTRIGLVVLSYPSPQQWLDSSLRLYEVTAVQLALAIDHRLQQNSLYERGRQVAVFEERQRLARELHDSVTQLIFSMTLITQSIAPAWRRNPAEGERRADRLLELSQTALSEMRALLFELRPIEKASRPGETIAMPGLLRIQQDGLVSALRHLIHFLSEDGPKIELQTHHYRPQPLEIEEAVYRITQEGLNNGLKHAQAQQILVKLALFPNQLQLIIQDDGQGFEWPLPAGTNQHHLGLATMQERSKALGGKWQLMTRPGQGTTLVITIPISNRKSQ